MVIFNLVVLLFVTYFLGMSIATFIEDRYRLSSYIIKCATYFLMLYVTEQRLPELIKYIKGMI